MTTEWYSASELAGLPGMPTTDRGVRKKAKTEAWKCRKRKGRGGGMEFHLSALPANARDFLLEQTLSAIPGATGLPATKPVTKRSATTAGLPATRPVTTPATAPASPAEMLPAPATLAKWQRDTMDARCAILNLVEQVAGVHGVNCAINKIVAQAKTGMLPAHVQALIPVANARSGGKSGKQTLSRRTIFRWRELRAVGVTALAPKEQASAPVPAWAPYFLKCYKRPQKPSVADALEDLAQILPPGVDMPSAHQCYRLLKKMSNVDRERGRRTGNDLRSLLPMRRRSTGDLLPLDVVTCDGHTFKAKIAHPAHGRPFSPEVCAVIDAATRRAIGWSAGLAESAETVADALRHAISNTGIPLIFYTDPGSGNKAHVNSHPAFGRYARLGIEFKTGIPGRTQARGLIERFQKSCWIRSAKKLPTYKGPDMDDTALYRTTRLLDRDIRQAGRSHMLMDWHTFIAFMRTEAIERYNNRPHSSLPKITDETGRRRNMTPNEMWAFYEGRGWMPEKVTEAELADLFRPRIIKTTRRGEVRLFGNIYYHGELSHYTGEEVIVEYEPQDGGFVYVRDLEERLICRAEFEKNKSSYFPVSAIEQAAENRAKRRAKIKERQLSEIELERRGSTVIDIHPEPAVIEARKLLVEEMTRPEPSLPGIPENDKDRWRLWKRLDARHADGESISEELLRFYENWRNSSAWKSFDRMERDLAEDRAAIK